MVTLFHLKLAPTYSLNSWVVFIIPNAKLWDGSASCNASDGELAAVGYSGSV